MQPLVSVIVPVYNTEDFLPQCIESILGQTYENIELICVDDGSTDSSLSILEQYAVSDERMTVLHQENKFSGAARNLGMANSKGEYLLFLDSDDFFDTTMVEKMVADAEKNGSDIVICHSFHYDNNTGEVKPIGYSLKHLEGRTSFSGKEMAPFTFQFCVGWPWDKLFRRSFVEKNRLDFQSQRTTNDAFFVFMAVAIAEKITVIEDGLAYHRINNGSSISNTRELSYMCAFNAMDKIRARLLEDGIFETYEQSFVNWQVHFSMWNFSTITGDAQNEVGKIIRDKIFPQVYAKKRPKGFFYNPHELDMFTKVASFKNWYGVDDVATVRSRPSKKPGESPAVSVLVPIYNVSEYLDQALTSLVTQTLRDIEVICINDGSRDDSLIIAKSYELMDPRIVVINKSNGGYGIGMNIGLDCARGKYIAILEPDDYYLPNMLKTLYTTAEKNGAQIVKSDFYRFEGSGRAQNRQMFYVGCNRDETKIGDRTYYDRILCPREEQEVFKFTMNTWCGIYRSEFLEKNHIRHNETPGASFQDNGFWFIGYALADWVMLISKPGYMNRRDNPNSSVKDPGKALANRNEYMHIREDLIARGHGLFEKLSTTFWLKYVDNLNASLDRVSNELCGEVMEVGRQDLIGALERGEIDREKLPKGVLEDIDNLIADPVVFRYGKLDQKVNAEKHRYSDIQRELTEMENS
ncbi:MAG: glycosyltransferase family 2 protein, partial [Coriobacteriales bacterium]